MTSTSRQFNAAPVRPSRIGVVVHYGWCALGFLCIRGGLHWGWVCMGGSAIMINTGSGAHWMWFSVGRCALRLALHKRWCVLGAWYALGLVCIGSGLRWGYCTFGSVASGGNICCAFYRPASQNVSPYCATNTGTDTRNNANTVTPEIVPTGLVPL